MKMTQKEKDEQGLYQWKLSTRRAYGEGKLMLSLEEIEKLIEVDPTFFTIADITYVEEVVEEMRMEQAMKHDFIKKLNGLPSIGFED
jgi:hypothetical protein